MEGKSDRERGGGGGGGGERKQSFCFRLFYLFLSTVIYSIVIKCKLVHRTTIEKKRKEK